jgi:hypothetical protein
MTRKFLDLDSTIPEEWTLGDDGAMVRRFQDVEPIVADVEAKRAATGGKCGLGWHIGSIPEAVAQEYARLRGIEFSDLLYNPAYADELVRLCQMQEYRKFSPTEGKA